MKQLIVLFLLLIVIAFSANAQQRIRLSMSPDSIRVGELSTVLWSFDVPAGSKVVLMPQIPDSLPGGIEVIDKQQIITEKLNGSQRTSQKLTVSVYDSGNFVFPALQAMCVSGTDTVLLQSDSLFLYATTVPVDTTAAVKDVKDIYDVPEETDFRWLWYVVGGVLLAIVAFFIFNFIRKRRKQIPVAEEEVVWENPVERALEALRKMQENRDWMSMLPGDFYKEVTDILRKYLFYAHHIHAAEMVSSEMMNAVLAAAMPAQANAKLLSVLQVADMAKFARFKPQPGMFEKSLGDAIAFVEETRPVELNLTDNEMAK
ncbi:MAG: hypothetical protein CVU11_08915 [Bacteroidetes bacterium HGW-Bacteroidetes-6]|jgi:DNA-binding ferritin-like protein (Dps family)|nr:MAG: hypothetical protein CVU11_08915 [Bacteroidetes bacterium HGW-Bacteroidetes-6]